MSLLDKRVFRKLNLFSITSRMNDDIQYSDGSNIPHYLLLHGYLRMSRFVMVRCCSDHRIWMMSQVTFSERGIFFDFGTWQYQRSRTVGLEDRSDRMYACTNTVGQFIISNIVSTLIKIHDNLTIVALSKEHFIIASPCRVLI